MCLQFNKVKVLAIALEQLPLKELLWTLRISAGNLSKLASRGKSLYTLDTSSAQGGQ